MKKILGLLLLVPSLSFASNTWYNYHWNHLTTDPVVIAIIDSTTGVWVDVMNQALIKWDESPVINLTVTRTETDDVSRQLCPLNVGAIRVCNYNYGTNGWLGLATVGIDGTGHVDRSTTMINTSYSSSWNDLALRNHVMCQEIGHGFGLGHTSEDGSSQSTCMDYSHSLSSQWPNAHDYQMLLDIYSHTHTAPPPPTEEPKPGKGRGKPRKFQAEEDVVILPPMGVRVNGNPRSDREVWVSPREDGGLWVHTIWLAEEEVDEMEEE